MQHMQALWRRCRWSMQNPIPPRTSGVADRAVPAIGLPAAQQRRAIPPMSSGSPYVWTYSALRQPIRHTISASSRVDHVSRQRQKRALDSTGDICWLTARYETSVTDLHTLVRIVAAGIATDNYCLCVSGCMIHYEAIRERPAERGYGCREAGCHVCGHPPRNCLGN